MSVQAYVVVFALGSAALALWVDARFPRLGPDRLPFFVLHLGAVFLLTHLVAAGFAFADERGTTPLVPLLAIALPAVIYSFLVGLWVLKFLQGAVARYSR